MRKMLAVIPGTLLICLGFLSSSCATAGSAEIRYWNQSLSIDENHLENGAIPFLQVWMKAIPAIQNGHSEKYADFFLAVQEYERGLKRTLDRFGTLTPPTEEAARWQQMQGEAWEILHAALIMYERCWDYDAHVVSGTTEALLAADERLYESQAAQAEADLAHKKALMNLNVFRVSLPAGYQAPILPG